MRRQNGRTILIGRQNMKFITSDRYSILHKEGVNDLTIYNVTENDIGEYICQINTEPMKNYVRIFNIVSYIFLKSFSFSAFYSKCYAISRNHRILWLSHSRRRSKSGPKLQSYWQSKPQNQMETA